MPALFRRLNKLSDKLKSYNLEFLFVDDGSKDRTLDLLRDAAVRDKRVNFVRLSRNFGKETALKAGIDHLTSDAVIILDADLQDPPELVPKMVKFWQQGFDDVYARRVSRDGESFMKKFTSWGYFKVLKRTTKIPIQEHTGDFRLLDKKCVAALRKLSETNRNTKAFYSWIGFSKKEITYRRQARAAGKTKLRWGTLIKHAIDGITSFTTAPLRFATILGLAISLASFIFILFVVIRTLIHGPDTSGWPSMMSVILFLGGVQLLALGIIGEYVGRIFDETKRRPLYFIEEIHLGKNSRK